VELRAPARGLARSPVGTTVTVRIDPARTHLVPPAGQAGREPRGAVQ